MQPPERPAGGFREGALGSFGAGLVPEPYDSFMRSHLRYYGYFRGEPQPLGRGPSVPAALQPSSPQGQKNPESPVVSEQLPTNRHPAEGPRIGSAHPGCPRGPRQELSCE